MFCIFLESAWLRNLFLQISDSYKEGATAPQNHLYLEKLGKFLTNNTKIQAVFAEISENTRYKNLLVS